VREFREEEEAANVELRLERKSVPEAVAVVKPSAIVSITQVVALHWIGRILGASELHEQRDMAGREVRVKFKELKLWSAR
jgi:hypothetical protein